MVKNFFWYSIDNRINELQDQLATTHDQLQRITSDISQLHGERSDKYKELKKREESMKGIEFSKILI